MLRDSEEQGLHAMQEETHRNIRILTRSNGHLRWFIFLVIIYFLNMFWKYAPFFEEHEDYFVKSNAEEAKSFFTLMLYGYLIYFVSDMKYLPGPFTFLYFLSCLASSFVFPCIGKLPGMQFSVSADSIQSYGVGAWLVLAFLLLCITSVSIYQAYVARRNRQTSWLHYLVPIMLVPAGILTMVPPILPVINATNVSFHLHHAFMAYVLAMFCNQNNVVSRIAHAFSVGVFIQGVCFFGSRDATMFA